MNLYQAFVKTRTCIDRVIHRIYGLLVMEGFKSPSMLKVSLFRGVHNAFHDCVGYSIKRFKKKRIIEWFIY